jgi:hypothetical protein
MGAGASVPDVLDEATAKDISGDAFNQALFDSTKDADGNITRVQFEEHRQAHTLAKLDVDAVAGIKVSASAPAQVGTAVELEAQVREATEKEGKQLAHVRGLMAHDALAVALFNYEENLLSQEEREARQAKRRALIRDGCQAAMKEFEEMDDEEKFAPQHQGRMEFYSDKAQSTRESIRNHHRITRQLLRWWNATLVFDDRDDDDYLSKTEYEGFYKRLLKLLDDNDDPDDDMSEEEKKEAMAGDFKADAGADGSVSKEEFKNSVFQLADQWTETLEVSEYEEFLKQGYDIVYGDLDMSDKIVFPASWNKLTKKSLNVGAMKVDLATETITEIYRKKLEADNADDAKKRKRDTMEQFVIEFFENKYGRGMRDTRDDMQHICPTHHPVVHTFQQTRMPYPHLALPTSSNGQTPQDRSA